MAVKKKDEERGSLLPKDGMAGGGAVPSGKGKIVKARFAHFNYSEQEVTDDHDEPFGLAIWFEMQDEDDPREQPQFYSGGKDREATEDGTGFTGKPGLPANSNAMALIQSLLDADSSFEEKLADGDISILDGLEVELEEAAQPERKGAGTKGSTYALITAVGKKSSKKETKPAVKSTSKKKEEEPDDDEESNDAGPAFVKAQLKKAKKPMSKKDLTKIAFKELKGEEKSAMIEFLGDDDQLSEIEGVSFDGNELELE